MKFEPIKYRAHNGYDTEQASNQAAVDPTPWGPSMTAQDMAEDADINTLMRRFGLTGHFPVNPKVPMEGDFSNVGDFRSALEAVARATDQFNEYPADLRARFRNDPGEFAEFCLNPENREEMRRLKLLKDPEPAATPTAGPSGGTRLEEPQRGSEGGNSGGNR